MKDAVGFLLREAWKQKGTVECSHPDLSHERSFSGVVTGAYICTTCGQLIQIEHPGKVQPSAKRHR